MNDGSREFRSRVRSRAAVGGRRSRWTPAFVGAALALAGSLAACPSLFTELDNPVDPLAASYPGYETVKDPDGIEAVAPTDGAVLRGAELVAKAVAGSGAYALRLAADPAALESGPWLIDGSGYSSNVFDIADAALAPDAVYYWKVRARTADGASWGEWSPGASFVVGWPAAPTLSPPGGKYIVGPRVSIACATAGATIWYTLDGSDPAASATRLSGTGTVTLGALEIHPATRVRAIATLPDTLPSTVTDQSYAGTLMTMVEAPAGSFTMGSNGGFANERPPHTVQVSAYYISAYETTQAIYCQIMGGTAASPSAPIASITWFDAVEFCNRLSEYEGFQTVYSISGRVPPTGYPITAASVTADWSRDGFRLPTEAEWEYACRAGTTTTYYWGDAMDGAYGWYSANTSAPVAVGQKTPNAFGLYDPSGNVLEWCWDFYASAYPSAEQFDPRGPESGTERVYRGGSYLSIADYLRSAFRTRTTPQTPGTNIGFRVAARARGS